MNKKISLRMRLTLITSLILILMCVGLTLFNLYNLNWNLVTPMGTAITANSAVDESAEGAFTNNDSNEILTATMQSNVNIFSNASVIFMLSVIIIGTLIMYIIAGVILKPVQMLTQKIIKIDKNQLSSRITDFSAGDELNKLADSFNAMLSRLEETFIRESRFSSDAAHELKTPLTVIKTNIDVLYLDEDPSKQDCLESLQVVKKQTNRMIALVNDLLDMSIVNRCKMDSLVQVNEVVEEIIEELAHRITEKHILLQLDLKQCSVKANSVMLKHAISNIVENAIKYNYEAGKIEVIVFSKESSCVICVNDTGIGISDEQAKYIFEPFYRVDKSRSRAVGGAGLGLSIATDIISKHHGTISYSSANPTGSIFKIVLPRA
ncbi:sensor histidine kinase [Clostridium estertheticum]|uniref:sensor histidine kinase n=1 Tax=Clostridium estertheticum TaxID=238834 RepID=UPI001CF5B947|nr:HAMP domain-containing sensor histidine kinase [Clostridium estertheticum]MCB2354540.1 HAMP domain-containing histidine kinase [Clostridium estertheticum]MCB2358466.1 HAMP domain-containing histidine kinase [Clostridium estertheticum]WAG40791.1 HAMP domain-containing histidine kinase [Clostridium estertheticum]